MVEPLVNIDKNIQKIVREFVDKEAPAEQAMVDAADKLDDINDSLENNANETKKQKKSFMSVIGGMKTVFGSIKGQLGSLAGHVKQGFSTLTGHFREVLGPVAEAFDSVKAMFGGTLGILKQMWGWAVASKIFTSKMWKWVQGHFTRAYKEQAREKGKIKGRIASLLDTLGFIIGVAIGGIVGMLLKPLQLLIKLVMSPITLLKKLLAWEKLIGPKASRIGTIFFGWIHGLFDKLRSIRSTWIKKLKLTRVVNFFKAIGRFFGWIGEGTVKVLKFLKKIPMLGGLIRGVTFGLKILGWPFVLLLSLYDGIKAFITSSGPMLDRVTAGLVAAFDSIFELPIKILAWIPTKVLSMFGIDFDVGTYVIDLFHDIIGFITESISKAFTVDNFMWFKDRASEMLVGLYDWFMGLGTFFDNLWTTFGKFLSWDTLKKVGMGYDPMVLFGETFESVKNGGSGVGDAVNNTNKLKNKAENEKMDKFIASEDKKGKEMLKAFNETMKNDKANNTSIMSNRSGGSDSGQKPIVKDSGNGFFNFMNSNVYGGS